MHLKPNSLKNIHFLLDSSNQNNESSAILIFINSKAAIRIGYLITD